MAFINKFFSIKKKNPKNNNDNGWAGFTFSDQQVRIILFRECEWQNRQLLFDSSAVRKLVVNGTATASKASSIGAHPNNSNSSNNIDSFSQSTNSRKISTDNTLSQRQLSTSQIEENQNSNKKTSANEDVQTKTTLIETSNGSVYQINRPNGDINMLGEMIFGSAALTFRGTCLKIHSLRSNTDSTKSIMCTHIFCPPVRTNQRPSITNRNTKPSSLLSSTTSDLSSTTCTTTTDSLKCGQKSWPLDVPRIDTMESDSGIEQSAGSSASSMGPPSFMSLDANLNDKFSNSISINRRTFRNLTTSLDYWPSSSYHSNTNSGPVCGNSYSSTQHSGSYNENANATNSINDFYRRNSSSTEESLSNSCSTRVKLGLAVIIELTLAQEKELELYLLEHMPILDTIMWRLRDCVQRAYWWRKTSFIPIMMDGSKEAATSIQLLMNSINKSVLTMPPFPFFWYQDGLSFTNDLSCSSTSSNDEMNNKNDLLNSTSPTNNKSDLFWKMFFKTDLTILTRNETEIEKLVRVFCDLLKLLDNKDTNFFFSALITAVLTHHLGWILSFSSRNDLNEEILPPCSALWTQLSEMSGAIGCPSKFAQTVVVGKTDKYMIDVLYILSYFTRFSSILRKNEVRVENDKEEEIFNETLQRLNNINRNSNKNIKIVNNNVDDLKTKQVINKTNVVDNAEDNLYEMKNLSTKDLCSSYSKKDQLFTTKNYYCDECMKILSISEC
ncbi:folliculin-interacting protein 2-like [Chrysoperla carnea]|uniref:folliculin-interacting protein 2-like n=1 Tax=Chrysoperla carnea TaxID=189513 RepID=UPI001D079270|nr:folliculin-interacting protein 2-like [Chrysoperla carnea]